MKKLNKPNIAFKTERIKVPKIVGVDRIAKEARKLSYAEVDMLYDMILEEYRKAKFLIRKIEETYFTLFNRLSNILEKKEIEWGIKQLRRVAKGELVYLGRYTFMDLLHKDYISYRGIPDEEVGKLYVGYTEISIEAQKAKIKVDGEEIDVVVVRPSLIDIPEYVEKEMPIYVVTSKLTKEVVEELMRRIADIIVKHRKVYTNVSMEVFEEKVSKSPS